MNIIMITGASSGIGMEFALQMDKHFNNIDEFWLVARRRDRLEELAKALRHRTRIFSMDITKKENLDILERAVVGREVEDEVTVGREKAGKVGSEQETAGNDDVCQATTGNDDARQGTTGNDDVQQETTENDDFRQETAGEVSLGQKTTVRMLINCAGYGMMGSFDRQNADTALGMIRLNCEVLTDLTHRMIPYMKRGSRVIQMASSAAFLPQPYFAVYAASKSYVLSFSRALGEELKDRGIYITSVCPGPVDTPFFDIAESTGSTLAVKKYTMVSVDRVVALALKDSYEKRPMSVCSLPMKAFWMISKVMPHDILLKIMEQMKRKGL